MISPPSSSPSSPSPRKVKSSNQSSAASVDEENENNSMNENEEEINSVINSSENDQKSITNDEQKSIANEDQQSITNDEQKSISNDEQKSISNDEQKSITNDEQQSLLSDNNKEELHNSGNENEEDHHEPNEEEDIEDHQSQRSSALNTEQSSFQEEEDSHDSPVNLKSIIDNGLILTNQGNQSEEEDQEINYYNNDDNNDNYNDDINNNDNVNSDNNNNKNEQSAKDRANDVQYWTDEAMQLHPLTGCNPRILNQVIENIRRERDNLIDLGMYQDSVQANEAMSRAQEYKDSSTKKKIQKKKQDELERRLEDAKQYLHNLESAVSRIEPNMSTSLEKERNNLIKRQNHELNVLSVEWNSDQKKRMYNRSSGNLRSLRTQSILLFNSHRFEEMELASRTADAMEVDEAESNQRRLEMDFQDALNKMLDRHQEERKQLEIAHKVQKEKFKAAKDHDLAIAKRRIDKLQREIEDSKDPEKVWVHYTRAEARGPAGPRPKPREGRKNLQNINTRDFNTLNLPPLVDSPKWKKDSPRSPRERQEMAKEIAALSRTGGSAALAAIISGRRHGGARASYGSTCSSPRSPKGKK